MGPLRRLFQLTAGVFLVALTASGQPLHPNLPCAFDGPLLRDARGNIVQYTSDEMKHRAIAKQDLNGFIKQLDFRSVMFLKLLVSETGTVICVKTISGIPIAQKPTEDAVRRWRFRAANMGGKPVSYIGWLEFTLCNVCGTDEFGVSLLK